LDTQKQKTNYLERQMKDRKKWDWIIGIGIVMAFLAGTVEYAKAQEAPSNFNTKTVPFFLACSTPTDMRDTLLEVHGEVAMIAGWLDTGNQYLLYTNKSGTTMSFVIHKSDGEACLIWSGMSEKGRAYIPNPSPQFPSDVLTERQPQIEDKWN